MAAPSSISSPGLQEATKNSTTGWQQDLEALFHHAKDRFPDVVWELGGAEDDDSNRKDVEEVWGHKGQPWIGNQLLFLFCSSLSATTSDRLCKGPPKLPDTIFLI
jgi:hypothetical protein